MPYSSYSFRVGLSSQGILAVSGPCQQAKRPRRRARCLQGPLRSNVLGLLRRQSFCHDADNRHHHHSHRHRHRHRHPKKIKSQENKTMSLSFHTPRPFESIGGWRLVIAGRVFCSWHEDNPSATRHGERSLKLYTLMPEKGRMGESRLRSGYQTREPGSLPCSQRQSFFIFMTHQRIQQLAGERQRRGVTSSLGFQTPSTGRRIPILLMPSPAFRGKEEKWLANRTVGWREHGQIAIVVYG